MNILITSAGRRVKVIQYFKQSFNKNGKVIAADCSNKAPALYFADEYEIIPKIDSEFYIQKVLYICKKHEIQAIVSLLDPELEILANYRDSFEKYNIQLILSSTDMIEMSFDKQKTYDYLSNLEIPVVPTFSKKSSFIQRVMKKEFSFPAVVKPSKGSASLGLYIAENESELNNIFSDGKGLIIQPFYKNKEFGIDVYVDFNSGELVDMFIKEKLIMRSGETDKSISIKNDKIESLILDLIHKTNFKGPIDIDCFEFEGEYYISEINPRFGGGYPHAYELDCNFMNYILNNLKGKTNRSYKGFTYNNGVIMMKYDDVKLIKE